MAETSTESATPNDSDMGYMPDSLREILHTAPIFRKRLPSLMEIQNKSMFANPLRVTLEKVAQVAGERRMNHEVWDIVRDVAGGTIVLLLGVLIKRFLADHDAKKQAEKDWRDRVDNFITKGERRKHPRGSASGKANGLDSHHDANGGPGDRVRRRTPPDEE